MTGAEPSEGEGYDPSDTVLWEMALEAFEAKVPNPAANEAGDLWTYLHDAVGMNRVLYEAIFEAQRDLAAARDELGRVRAAALGVLNAEGRLITYAPGADDMAFVRLRAALATPAPERQDEGSTDRKENGDGADVQAPHGDDRGGRAGQALQHHTDDVRAGGGGTQGVPGMAEAGGDLEHDGPVSRELLTERQDEGSERGEAER